MLQRKREAEAERQKQAKAAGIAALFGAGSGRIPAGVDAPMAGADTAGSSGQFAGGGEDGPSSTGQPANGVSKYLHCTCCGICCQSCRYCCFCSSHCYDHHNHKNNE